MAIRNRDRVVQVEVDERTWLALGFEGVRRNRGRGRVLLSLAEAGGLTELRKQAKDQ